VEQQDREQHDKQTEENAGCVHKSDPSWRVLHRPSQSLKPRADIAELIDFAQGRGKRHRQTAPLAEKPKVGELQMDWLRSEDLKEEKNVTTPLAIIAVEEPVGLSR
jgi:hypothetical protein